MIQYVCTLETGRVYTFGCGQNGQLGLGGFENQSYPTVVDGPLVREVVTQISCGRAHTIAVTSKLIPSKLQQYLFSFTIIASIHYLIEVVNRYSQNLIRKQNENR